MTGVIISLDIMTQCILHFWCDLIVHTEPDASCFKILMCTSTLLAQLLINPLQIT